MKRVFYITLAEITVFHWEKNQILDAIRFPANENGQSDFLKYIEREPNTPSVALVDLVEEEFQTLLVPHLNAANRHKFLARKLKSHFRKTPYRLALYRGKSADKKNQDEVILTALTNPDTLSLFLSWVQICHVPLSGIYSVPHISDQILKALKINQANTLLVTEQAQGQFRQSFFHGQSLMTSRLSIPTDIKPGEFAESIVKEVEDNERYLNRFNLLPRQTKLSVNIVCSENHYDELNEQLGKDNRWDFNLIHAEHLRQQCKLRSPMQANQLEMLFAHLLCTHRFQHNYAQSHDKRYFYFENIKRGLVAASFLIGIGSVAYASQLYINASGYKASTALAKQNVAYLSHHLAKAKKDTPATRYLPQAIAKTVELDTRLQRTAFKPKQLFQLIGQSMTAFPDIQIDHLAWKTHEHNPFAQQQAQRFTRQRKAVDEKALYRVVTIKARFQEYPRSYIEVYQRIQEFKRALLAHKQISEVRLLKLPIEVKPDKLSQGSSGAHDKKLKARFVIKFLIRSQFDET